MYPLFSELIFAMSDNGVKLLKRLEGLRLQPYPDGTGYAIGYGHFIESGEEWMMNGITADQAESIFENDLQYYEQVVSDAFYNSAGDAYGAGLTQEQFEALVCFAFDVGPDGFDNSKLVQLIQAGSDARTVHDFWLTSFVTSAGLPDAGLVSRRKIEADYAFPNLPAAKKGTSWAWLLILGVGGYLYTKS